VGNRFMQAQARSQTACCMFFQCYRQGSASSIRAGPVLTFRAKPPAEGAGGRVEDEQQQAAPMEE
jgi:hypothetical protein